jgi:hypothetical protein
MKILLVAIVGLGLVVLPAIGMAMAREDTRPKEERSALSIVLRVIGYVFLWVIIRLMILQFWPR